MWAARKGTHSIRNSFFSKLALHLKGVRLVSKFMLYKNSTAFCLGLFNFGLGYVGRRFRDVGQGTRFLWNTTSEEIFLDSHTFNDKLFTAV